MSSPLSASSPGKWECCVHGDRWSTYCFTAWDHDYRYGGWMHREPATSPPEHRIVFMWQSDWEPILDCSCGWTFIAGALDTDLEIATYAHRHFQLHLDRERSR